MKKIFLLIALFLLGFSLVYALAVVTDKIQVGAVEIQAQPVNGDCQDIYAPDPESFEADVKPGAGVIMATYTWFEETEGTWVLKMDTDPRNDHENWVTEYPNWWFLAKPITLPQTIIEHTCLVCQTYSCQACQNNPNDYEKRLGACYEEFVTTCGDNYGCHWEGCETNDVLRISVCQPTWVCEDTCEPDITPTPTPERSREESKPSGCTENCPIPACSAELVVNEPANFHVYRNGDTALLKWFATGGNKVHAYWKTPGNDGWQHSTTSDNTGYLEIHALGTADWTFGLEQVNDCGGGVITAGRIMEVVDGNTHHWVLFRL